jgi:hypothetical protein
LRKGGIIQIMCHSLKQNCTNPGVLNVDLSESLLCKKEEENKEKKENLFEIAKNGYRCLMCLGCL